MCMVSVFWSNILVQDVEVGRRVAGQGWAVVAGKVYMAQFEPANLKRGAPAIPIRWLDASGIDVARTAN